jgi:RNA polymerase sigma-70 factor (ECF subfamily)
MQDGGDDDLMRRAGLGDRAAFSRLVARHLARATGVAGRITGNRSDAEEVVQEAFLRAWLKAPDWQAQADRPADDGQGDAGPAAASPPEGRGTASFATWFYRVLVNLCIDRKRRPVTAPIEAAEDVADPSPSGFEAAAQAELRSKVGAAIEALPERQRAALVLCHFEGVTNIDAAAILEVSIGALESLLVRARRALKDALQELAPERSTAKGRAPRGLTP